MSNYENIEVRDDRNQPLFRSMARAAELTVKTGDLVERMQEEYPEIDLAYTDTADLPFDFRCAIAKNDRALELWRSLREEAGIKDEWAVRYV